MVHGQEEHHVLPSGWAWRSASHASPRSKKATPSTVQWFSAAWERNATWSDLWTRWRELSNASLNACLQAHVPCTHARTHARTHACMYTRTHAHAHTHACMYTCTHARTHTETHFLTAPPPVRYQHLHHLLQLLARSCICRRLDRIHVPAEQSIVTTAC